MIEVNNLTKRKIDGIFLKKIAKKILKSENKEGLDVSIGIVGKEEIRELNNKYREKDQPTDVLSFRYEDSGEIVLCPEVIKQNAETFKTSFPKELTRILVHGLLHLAGYNHSEMREKQDYYAKF